MKLAIFLGVQLSGKSTLARKIAATEDFPVLSIDHIRNSLYGYLSGPKDWQNEQSKEALNLQTKQAYDYLFSIIGDAIKWEQSLVVELPHLGNREEVLLDFVEKYGVKIKIIWCYISNDDDEEICRRISLRAKNETAAPVRLEDYKMFKTRIQKPKYFEIFELDTSHPIEDCLVEVGKYLHS